MKGSEKINLLLKHLSLNPSDFAKAVRLKHVQNIYDIQKDKVDISKQMANKIIAAFPNLNMSWLLTGEEPMLKEESDSNVNKKTYKTYPLIPLDAIAGFDTEDNPGIKYEDCEQYQVPDFEDRGMEFLIRVSGSSMYPKYSSGDVLAIRKITDILFFQWGKVYVIDSSQGILVKRIFEDKDNPDNIICVSDNKEKYPPFSMPKSDIRSLSIVIGAVRME